ncbi:MAG: hypothetical protein AAGM84_06490 [Pseudomonadota bacterium]
MTTLNLIADPTTDPNVVQMQPGDEEVVLVPDWDGVDLTVDVLTSTNTFVFTGAFKSGTLTFTTDTGFLGVQNSSNNDATGFAGAFNVSVERADLVFDGRFDTNAFLRAEVTGGGNTITIAEDADVIARFDISDRDVADLKAVLSGRTTGIGDTLALVNDGGVLLESIDGGPSLVVRDMDRFVLTNSGTFDAAADIEQVLFTRIDNSGTFQGALDLDFGGRLVVTNTGNWGAAVLGSGDDDLVRSNGSWTGAVIDLSLGDDRFDMRGGTGAGFQGRGAPDTAPVQLLGDAGDDTYLVDGMAGATTGFVVVEESGRGFDSILSNSSYILPEHVERLVLLGTGDGTGNGLDNVIVGSGTANLLEGQGGADLLVGGGGADTLNGGAGDDRLVLGAGGGTVNGGADHDRLILTRATGGVTVDLGAGTGTTAGGNAIAVTGVEDIIGSAFGDRLTGTAGANLIRGGEGDDVITGGGGGDRLFGGDGADVFVFTAIDENRGRVLDFEQGTDLLSFAGLGLSFVNTAGFSGTGAELRQVSASGGTDSVVQVDLTGDRIAEFSIYIHGVSSLVLSDLIL